MLSLPMNVPRPLGRRGVLRSIFAKCGGREADMLSQRVPIACSHIQRIPGSISNRGSDPRCHGSMAITSDSAEISRELRAGGSWSEHDTGDSWRTDEPCSTTTSAAIATVDRRHGRISILAAGTC